MTDAINEDDFARARRDPEFRQKLMSQQLERLLEALRTMRKVNSPDPRRAAQMREGVDLAVKLADRLHKQAGRQDSQSA